MTLPGWSRREVIGLERLGNFGNQFVDDGLAIAVSTRMPFLHRALQRRCHVSPQATFFVLLLPGIIPHDWRAVCNYFNSPWLADPASGDVGLGP